MAERDWWSRAEIGSRLMAMPQRDDTVVAIKQLEPPSRVRCVAPGALLEHAVMHGDEKRPNASARNSAS